MELILGLIFVTSWICVAPKVIADAIATTRASAAGEWDVVDRERERRDLRQAARRERWAKAWNGVRAARNRQAGGTGDYRPGAKAYLGDLYHGFWEDQLEKRQAERAARPPYEVDPDRPSLRDRIQAGVDQRVQGMRERAGRVGRALIDPVWERQQPAPAEQVEEEQQPAPDGPRTACPECGVTMTRVDGSWQHPDNPDCPVAGLADQMHNVRFESSVVHEDDTYVVKPAPQYATCPRCGATHPAHVRAKINGERGCPTCAAEFVRRLTDEQRPGGTTCTRCRIRPSYPTAVSGRNLCNECDNVLISLRHEADRWWSLLDPDGSRGHSVADEVAAELAKRNKLGWTTTEMRSMTGRVRLEAERRAANQKTSSNPADGGNTMSTTTATGDVLSHNQAVAAHETALKKLRAQHAEAAVFGQHLTYALAAVEAMDGSRGEVTTALADLADGLEHGRYGADATQGAVEAGSVMTAGAIADVQEHLEAAAERNTVWMTELAASAESVQASMQAIQATYGEAAATVQETGIDARVLEEH